MNDKERDAIKEIFDAYIDAGRGPSDAVIEFFYDQFAGSQNEWKKWFGKYARSKGSNLFFGQYPAFGQPGCEFDAPQE